MVPKQRHVSLFFLFLLEVSICTGLHLLSMTLFLNTNTHILFITMNQSQWIDTFLSWPRSYKSDITHGGLFTRYHWQWVGEDYLHWLILARKPNMAEKVKLIVRLGQRPVLWGATLKAVADPLLNSFSLIRPRYAIGNKHYQTIKDGWCIICKGWID